MSNKHGSDDGHNGGLERKARTLFDGSVERLDARTRSKLTHARNRAVDEAKHGAAQRRWIWAPAGGFAAAALVAVVLWPGAGKMPSEARAVPLEDFDIVADGESLEMLQDVEFYVWLEDEMPGAGNPNG